MSYVIVLLDRLTGLVAILGLISMISDQSGFSDNA